MSLTLSNNLTGSTVREINAMTRNANILGTSMINGLFRISWGIAINLNMGYSDMYKLYNPQ